jgi:hypothetical protein
MCIGGKRETQGSKVKIRVIVIVDSANHNGGAREGGREGDGSVGVDAEEGRKVGRTARMEGTQM